MVPKRVLCAAGVLATLLCPSTSPAAPITATCSGTTGDAASLKQAITTANGTAGADTVQLGRGCVYTLTAADNNWYGPNGLPPVSSEITVEGNGATIARSATAPNFRLFFVGADAASPNTNNYVSPGAGRLTLFELTLAGGLAQGGASDGGGGGAGMGGAIFSQGTVVVERVTLTGNTAVGGSASSSGIGNGGGGMGTDSVAGGFPMGSTGGGFGAGSFGGGTGGVAGVGGGGGAGFRTAESGGAGTSAAGPGGGPRTGVAGTGHTGAFGGNGGGGGSGCRSLTPCGAGGDGGDFGAGGSPGTPAKAPSPAGGGGGGGVGGGGAGTVDGTGGGGGFGAGGGRGFSNSPGGGGGGGFGGGGGADNGPGGWGGGTGTAAGGGGGAGMGGAIFNMQGQLTIRNSTLAGNMATGGADNVADHGKGLGGAVFNMSGSLTAVGSTFAGNSAADDGASIYNLVYDGATARSAQTTLRDTIVANGLGAVSLSSVKPPMATGLANLGSADAAVGEFDLVDTMAARDAGTISGAPLSADPKLGPLQSNGGSTQTMAPAADSPVIDAGSAFGLAADQRGLPRPFDFSALANAADGSDIGAVELQDGAGVPPGGAGVPPGGADMAPGDPGVSPRFGAMTLVSLKLARKAIQAAGPVAVVVSNANAFVIDGKLSGESVRRLRSGRATRPVKLRTKAFSVPAAATRTVRLRLPKSLSRLLERSGRLGLRFKAVVRGPDGQSRMVTRTLTPRLQRGRG